MRSMPAACTATSSCGVFDALRHRSGVEPPDHAGERVEDDLPVRVAEGPRHQVAVQLVDLGAYVQDHPVVGLAEADVVQGDGDTRPAKLLEGPAEAGDVEGRGVLHDLDHQERRSMPASRA